FKTIKYNYFNTGPIVETETGTYADKDAPITEKYVMWNHSIGEVMTSLLSSGLSMDSFKEFDYSPYNCFNETVCIEQDKYRIKHLDDKIPMVYSLVANKNK
ncbi:MAG: SAM-dependent methyltransferase, partial [Flavobacteriales bacterium]|nr:SAM-dependent methyltransferase [Flavobacteriales bacterium]